MALVAGPAVSQNAGPVVLPPARALTQPLLAPDANAVAWVVWRDGALVPLVGPAWTQNGTVPQVSRTVSVVAGAGGFSDANWYGLGTGSDPLDFAGDFTCSVAFDPPTSLAGTPVMLGNSNTTPSIGWLAQLTGTGQGRAWNNGTFVTTVNTAQATVNVLSFGRSGGTLFAKLNLGSTVSAAATLTAATAFVARIGRFENVGLSWGAGGFIYEVLCTATAFAESPVAAQHQRVHDRLAITAW